MSADKRPPIGDTLKVIRMIAEITAPEYQTSALALLQLAEMEELPRKPRELYAIRAGALAVLEAMKGFVESSILFNDLNNGAPTRN
jgi:hypothetical protein